MKEAKGGTELTGERVRRAINACGIGVFAATEDGRVGAARAAESCLYSGARTHRTARGASNLARIWLRRTAGD